MPNKGPKTPFIFCRKMGFVVDKVSEDSFYENLLLGMSRVLERSQCVSKLCLKRLSGIRQVDIRAWEHTNGAILPEDLRAFYSSIDGFFLNYEFSYDFPNSSDEERAVRMGVIQINGLNDLIRIFGYETKNTAQVHHASNGHSLTLSRDSKVFELANVDENGKVVLVYPTTYSVPSIWFFSGQMHFSYLAEDFTKYFRMCIAHLGIPCWQYIFSKTNIPEWTREMFNVILPGVLPEDRNLVEALTYKHLNEPTNKIDPSIFLNFASNGGQPVETTYSNVRQPEPKTRDKQKTKTMPRRAMSCKSKKEY